MVKTLLTLLFLIQIFYSRAQEVVHLELPYSITDSVIPLSENPGQEESYKNLGCGEYDSVRPSEETQPNVAWNYIRQNLKYPLKSRWLASQGKVMLQFQVDSLGNLYDLNLIRGLDNCINEVVLHTFQPFLQ